MTTPLFSLLGVETHVGPVRWTELPAPWLLTVIVIVGFLWIRALYRRERGRSRPWQRHLLAAIRTATLLAVVLVLSGPYREETRTASEPSHLVVLIDTSASMDTSEKYPPEEADKLLAAWDVARRPSSIADVSRGDLVRQFLAPEGEAMLRDWARRFELHVFAFDGDWRSITGPASSPLSEAEGETDRIGDLGLAVRNLDFNGGRTRLGAMLRNVANEFGRRQDRHLAGVILISDGRDTSDGESPIEVLAALGPVTEALRVTPVLVGSPSSGKNLSVERIRAKDEVLVGDEVMFETTLRQKGFLAGLSGVEIRMTVEQIADEDGNEDRRTYDVTGDSRRTRTTADVDLPAPDPDDPEASTEAEVRLRAPFERAGTFEVTIRAEAPPPHDDADSVSEDNVRTHIIRVRNTRIKVLYVEGKATWDWRFLSTLLTREPRHDEDDADRRNRFAVHVYLQDAERTYRQPSSADLKPLNEFPRTRKELFDYDVIILGDVDWRTLSKESPKHSKELTSLIVEFVEQGGGIALQSGVDYRNPLAFLETPLAQLLPISAHGSDKRDSQPDDLSTPFSIKLTDAGRRHPIFAVVPGSSEHPIATPEMIARTWEGERSISREWNWFWLYRAKGGLRPGAVDLARVKVPQGDRSLTDDRGQPLVVFATMNFGQGRVFWSALDTISRIRRELRDEVYGAFWEQVIRYLATYRLLGGNKRLKIFTDKDEYFVGETATITISALDDQFEPLSDEALDGVKLEMPDGETIELTGELAPKSLRLEGATGSYRYYLPLREQGAYRVWIEQTTRGPDGRTVRERAEKRIQVDYRAREKRLKMPDLDTLRAILKEANPPSRQGDVLRLYDLESFVAGTQNRPHERVLERSEKTQWDKTWVLLLITALLAIEWALRKRWQML